MSDLSQETLAASIEALIFVSREPVSCEKIVETLVACGHEVSGRQVKKVIADLQLHWDDPERNHGRGMVLKEMAGGYMFLSAPQVASTVQKIAENKPISLSKAQVEVLSIIAYRQPTTRVEVDEVRGVDSSFALKRLMQLNLVKILGKSEGLGRPLLYGTTKHFLEFFSLNSLNDLPTISQIESLGQDDELEAVDLDGHNISLKDLFKENKDAAIFSHDVQRMSEEALKSLDEALSRVASVEKNSREDREKK